MNFRFAGLICIAASTAAAGLTPYGLECEARVNPAGIDNLRPRLSWKLASDQAGLGQTAYQIVVATSPEGLNSPGMWDSGRVASPESLWIEYRGSAMHPFQQYWWRVRVWDQSLKPSEWSAAASWTTAMLSPGDMKGAWIAHPDHSLRSGPLPLFRREFTADKPVRRAVAMVAGAGFHELHVNGARIGDHVLAPAWTNYRATVMYETFDITERLRPGPNAVGVMLGNGFYNVAGGRYTKYTGSFGHPRLWMMLHIEFSDGKTTDVATDSAWRTREGPVTFSCIFGGEDYDARNELSGWDQPGFDASAWQSVTTVEAPGGAMRAQSSPPIRVQQTFQAVRITQPKPGITVYDLGQNFSGWPRATVSGPAGSAVKMTPGELLDGSGLVSQRSSGSPVWFSYTLNGRGSETWSPRFSYYGFRYVQVEGDAKVEKLEGQFVHLDAPRVGSFSSSNERFNRIHALIDAAIRSNLQHVITDCPHREKLGWLEQTYLMGASLMYNWDLRTLLPKTSRDMRESQMVNGLVPDIAPEYVAFRGGFRDSPEWGSASVFVPWQAWTWYGDRSVLKDSYLMMKGYVNYLGSRTEDGLLRYGLGDWYDIGPKGPGYSQLTPQGVTATATYYEDLRVLERVARMLGFEADAQHYAGRAAETRARFNREYYDAQRKTYATGSQTSLAMPLAFNLAPPEARASLVEKLASDIRGRGNHTSAGDIGYRYVLRALLEAKRSDVVFDLANNPVAPSYAAQLSAGATSLTEAWDANPHSSQNHLMLGHIEEWFYGGLAGIRPDPRSPGLRNILIEPDPAGDVKWVKAEWNSPRGPVKVNWETEGERLKLDVEIPPGMTAAVRLPGGSISRTGSGRHQFQGIIKRHGGGN